MSDLTGRVVVVTGADGGIGRAVAALGWVEQANRGSRGVKSIADALRTDNRKEST